MKTTTTIAAVVVDVVVVIVVDVVVKELLLMLLLLLLLPMLVQIIAIEKSNYAIFKRRISATLFRQKTTLLILAIIIRGFCLIAGFKIFHILTDM